MKKRKLGRVPVGGEDLSAIRDSEEDFETLFAEDQYDDLRQRERLHKRTFPEKFRDLSSGSTTLNLSLPNEQIRKLQQMAYRQGTTTETLIERAVDLFVAVAPDAGSQ